VRVRRQRPEGDPCGLDTEEGRLRQVSQQQAQLHAASPGIPACMSGLGPQECKLPRAAWLVLAKSLKWDAGRERVLTRPREVNQRAR
jgi:hypothetical protein